ncbi:MAG: V4R domain-containing protein [Candidatus Kariarchaeaceae archaeon]
MSLEVTPIRLIMFTSEDCVYCPPVEEIVKEVVGSGMQELVHVSTIDVQDDPDTASQYEIMALPSLVINESIVLEGGMDDDSVRDLLWSTLMSHALTTEKALSLTTNSLLAITMNAMDSLNGNRILRPSVGDFSHVGVYQQYLLSLYSLDPLIPFLLYKAGYQLGMVGMMHHVLTLLHPPLGKTSKRKSKFRHLARALELYFSDRELLPTQLAAGGKITAFDDATIVLRVNELASASIKIDVGEPMCGFTAGQLAGVTAVVMGEVNGMVRCKETHCMANGADFCSFTISIAEKAPLSLPPLETQEERAERRQNFYEVIHEMTGLIQDSQIMRKIQRQNARDFIHISVLQPIIVSLKFLDRLSGTILFNGGKELGIFGPGKDLLYRLVQESAVQVPVKFDEGVKLLYEFLTHPLTSLVREFGKIHLKYNSDHTYTLEIEDNAAIAGMSTATLGHTFCDFQAGFFAGRLHILIGVDPIVKEIECQGTGSNTCKFTITVR